MKRSRQQVLGQNFLKHAPTIERILGAARDRKGFAKTLLEIGPGGLALTGPLEALAKEQGLKLVVVERDRYLEPSIRQGIAEAELHFMDAATPQLVELIDRLDAQGLAPLMVVSNLPYSAASQILAMLCRRIGKITGAVVMVQKEMAQRMAAPAKSGHRGAFSLFIQSYFEPEILFDVPPSAFSPPPQVTSTVLALRPLENPLSKRIREPLQFERFCKMLFSQRRKMIRNPLGISPSAPPPPVFAKLGIDGTERPEVLPFEAVLQLYLAFGGK